MLQFEKERVTFREFSLDLFDVKFIKLFGSPYLFGPLVPFH